MASDTNISASGGAPQVTVSGGNLIRYRCQFFLVKPQGQTWPETNSRLKKIHEVTFNMDHEATDTFSLGPAAALENLRLSWAIDMLIPGGGGPLQYFAEVNIAQDGNAVMNWSDQGQITTPKAIGDVSQFEVQP
jgi:hypothetical protein